MCSGDEGRVRKRVVEPRNARPRGIIRFVRRIGVAGEVVELSRIEEWRGRKNRTRAVLKTISTMSIQG